MGISFSPVSTVVPVYATIQLKSCLIWPHIPFTDPSASDSFSKSCSQNSILWTTSSSFSACNNCEIQALKDASFKVQCTVISFVADLLECHHTGFCGKHSDCSSTSAVISSVFIVRFNPLLPLWTYLTMTCSSNLSSGHLTVSQDGGSIINSCLHIYCTSTAFSDFWFYTQKAMFLLPCCWFIEVHRDVQDANNARLHLPSLPSPFPFTSVKSGNKQ